MIRHHLIISGTGRSGTTFLVQLFTELGLDTGFKNTATGIFANCNAGMEHDILSRKGAPYLVKSPSLCDNLDDVVSTGKIIIDHALVPVRDLYSAAQSRRFVNANTDPTPQHKKIGVPGGLWLTDKPAEQEAVLAQQLYKLLYAIAKHNIPMTLLLFPRLVNDPTYLYEKIRFALGNITHDAFLAAFQKVSRPDLVHNFGAN